MTILLGFLLLIIFYTYIGYGLLLRVINSVKQLFGRTYEAPACDYFPPLTFIVPAYNEARWIEEKIKNTLLLQYPADKLTVIFITDGSTDGTAEIVGKYSTIRLMDGTIRQGKAAALNRAVAAVHEGLVVFSDANTRVNANALQLLARHFKRPDVGGVSGEKCITVSGTANAAFAEGTYWRYESQLKLEESRFYSVMGATGELFCIKRELFAPLPEDTLLDDLVISLRIMEKGFRIVYEPEAIAAESPSANTAEEMQRKLRMAAGGIQTFLRFKHLLLPRQPALTFCYVSHRVLRWLVTPYFLPLAFVINLWLLSGHGTAAIFILTGIAQLCWYLAAAAGWMLERIKKDGGWLFIPYYFCLMNLAMPGGLLRLVSGRQAVQWKKVRRADY